MKSKLLKASLLATAALAMGAMATSTQAKTLTYTFATASGSPYCDGMTLTSGAGGSYAGLHTGSCLGVNDSAGGFSVKLGKTKVIEAGTNYSGSVPEYTFYLDVKAGTWTLYTAEGSTWAFVNSGELLDGAPPVGHKGALSSRNPSKGAKKDPIFSY